MDWVFEYFETIQESIDFDCWGQLYFSVVSIDVKAISSNGEKFDLETYGFNGSILSFFMMNGLKNVHVSCPHLGLKKIDGFWDLKINLLKYDDVKFRNLFDQL